MEEIILSKSEKESLQRINKILSRDTISGQDLAKICVIVKRIQRKKGCI